MKKIYSFVLMAAALLIGANVWADTYTYPVSSAQQFEEAWAESASNDVVIDMTSSSVTLDKVMWLGTTNLTDESHSVVINLLGKTLTTNAAYGFLLTHGSLTINGPGTINCEGANEMFFITGSNAHATDFTKLEIGENVIINYNTYKAAISIDAVRTSGASYKANDNYIPAKAQLTYTTDIYTGKGAAMGVKVDVKGTIHARKYAVKANGDLGYAEADKDFAPFIHIYPTARVDVLSTTSESKKPIALYASGYANWLIEGRVEGNVGVMVKSGDVDIDGANIKSTNTATYGAANESKSGTEAQGSAIVISSEIAYSGEMDVTIGGNATITAGKGYAVDESVATPTNGTKVDALTIEGATFVADTETSTGAIVISETTAEQASTTSQTTIEVTSAKIEGTVTIGDGEGAKLDDYVTTSALVKPETAGDPTIVVPLDIDVKTFEGYATFSAPIDLYKATEKVGYTPFSIYRAKKSVGYLGLYEVNYVKAGEGVILKAAKGEKCHFTTSEPTDPYFEPSNYTPNEIKPSSAWATQTNKNAIYCLREVNNETLLYRYTGTDMPANKAYLDLSDSGSSAPQHIRMVIAQEEQTEAIESVEAASVKAVKFVENGEILIRRGENVYNLQGQIVK